jgi:DNA-binding GntR family transcriptional regulator
MRLAKLERGDPDGAEAAMRRHLGRTVELLHHEAELAEQDEGV